MREKINPKLRQQIEQDLALPYKIQINLTKTGAIAENNSGLLDILRVLGIHKSPEKFASVHELMTAVNKTVNFYNLQSSIELRNKNDNSRIVEIKASNGTIRKDGLIKFNEKIKFGLHVSILDRIAGNADIQAKTNADADDAIFFLLLLLLVNILQLTGVLTQKIYQKKK